MTTNEQRPKRARGYAYQLVKRVRSADPMHIGVKLGNLCIDKDIPVSVVAEELGVSRLTVYSWFTGQFYPSADRMRSVHELLIRYGLRDSV